MRVAIIDLGTNTFNLLIADLEIGSSKTVYKTKIAVKLGEDGIDKNVIQPNAFKRGVDAMISHKEAIASFQTTDIFAFATSAIRSASNGLDFVACVFEETGIKVKIIDGDYEAKLIYKGVRQAVEISEELVLIVDIGGGSTEFIIANNEKIVWEKSFDLGVSRIKEIFKPSDPISESDCEKLDKYFEEKLQPLFVEFDKYAINQLIGSSGSFDTFAEMLEINHNRNLTFNTTYTYDLIELRQLHALYLVSDIKQRIAMKGMIEFRADMIVIASLFVQFIINRLKIKQVKLSTYALKEGVLSEIIEENLNLKSL